MYLKFCITFHCINNFDKKFTIYLTENVADVCTSGSWNVKKICKIRYWIWVITSLSVHNINTLYLRTCNRCDLIKYNILIRDYNWADFLKQSRLFIKKIVITQKFQKGMVIYFAARVHTHLHRGMGEGILKKGSLSHRDNNTRLPLFD